jgi:hypothetical protein
LADTTDSVQEGCQREEHRTEVTEATEGGKFGTELSLADTTDSVQEGCQREEHRTEVTEATEGGNLGRSRVWRTPRLTCEKGVKEKSIAQWSRRPQRGEGC